jgi:hypothetical protein
MWDFDGFCGFNFTHSGHWHALVLQQMPHSLVVCNPCCFFTPSGDYGSWIDVNWRCLGMGWTLIHTDLRTCLAGAVRTAVWSGGASNDCNANGWAFHSRAVADSEAASRMSNIRSIPRRSWHIGTVGLVTACHSKVVTLAARCRDGYSTKKSKMEASNHLPNLPNKNGQLKSATQVTEVTAWLFNTFHNILRVIT